MMRFSALRVTGLAALALLVAGPVAAEPFDCDSAAEACSVEPSCLERYGAGAIAADAASDAEHARGCEAALGAYRACLGDVIAQCERSAAEAEPEPQPDEDVSSCSPEDARQIWAELKDSEDIAALQAFARECEGRPQATQAQLRADELRAEQAQREAKQRAIKEKVDDAGSVLTGGTTKGGAALGGSCRVGTDCRGYRAPIPNTTGVACCKGVCKRTKLAWTRVPVCP